MPTQLPRGARAIAKAGIAFCRVLDRHPLVEASDPSAVRQAAYAAIKTACAALQELVPDRFVDPGQDPALTALDFTDGVVVPTQYRRNGGRLTIRLERGGKVSFISAGLSPFNATTGDFIAPLGTFANVSDIYSGITARLVSYYSAANTLSLHSVEQTVGGNLTVVAPTGTYANATGASSNPDNPLYIISTINIRTGVPRELLKVKLPGVSIPLGKQTIVSNVSGTPLEQLVALLTATSAGVMAYNGHKGVGNGLLSTADNKREYARLTK